MARGVVYFGHGETDRWRNGILPIVKLSQASVFRGATIVYSMACESLSEFGRAVVSAGARAYIGNSEPVFGTAITKGINPARGFKAIWMNEVLNLVRGVDVENAVAFARQQWVEYAAMLGAAGEDPLVVAMARWNAAHHGYVGDGNARLPPQDFGVEVVD